MSPDRAGSFGDPQIEIPKFGVEKILIAGNRGPCGGVWRIFEQLDTAFDEINKVSPGTKVYINWYPVNNVPTTFAYEQKGLVNFKNDWSLVPERSLVIPSAHGVGPDFYEMAKAKNCDVIADGTCQLVTRVHNLAIKAENEGKVVVYVGVKGHPETEGVRKEIKISGNFILIEEDEDAESVILPEDRNKILLSQTTLSTKETAKKYARLKQRFPEMEIPSRWDICYATDSRQMSVEDLVAKASSLIVVGSRISHNSKELAMVFDSYGKPWHMVDEPDEVEPAWFDASNIVQAVTSGASVKDELLYPVVDRIVQLNPRAKIIHEEQIVPENLAMVFKYDAEAIRGVVRQHAQAA